LSFIFLFFDFFCLGSNLLEVESFDKSIKLVNSHFKLIVHESVSKENRIVGKFNLFDGVCNAYFELSFGFNSISNTLTQLFEGGWIDEEEIPFKGFGV
jgi:hypothetical protein